jgi:hypothetical protein
MATRWGWKTYLWLVERGWREATEPDKKVFGDPRIMDPVDGKEMTVHTAAKIHRERTGECPEWLLDAS